MEQIFPDQNKHIVNHSHKVIVIVFLEINYEFESYFYNKRIVLRNRSRVNLSGPIETGRMVH